MRLSNLHIAFGIGGILLLAGCATEPEIACTEIGAPAGIGIEVDPVIASQIADEATLTVKWSGGSAETKVALARSAASVDETCAGDHADESCTASAVPTGGKHGFAPITKLPDQRVTIILSLRDDAGQSVVHAVVEAYPQGTHPNGPDCPVGGVQTQLRVGEAGDVTPWV